MNSILSQHAHILSSRAIFRATLITVISVFCGFGMRDWLRVTPSEPASAELVEEAGEPGLSARPRYQDSSPPTKALDTPYVAQEGALPPKVQGMVFIHEMFHSFASIDVDDPVAMLQLAAAIDVNANGVVEAPELRNLEAQFPWENCELSDVFVSAALPQFALLDESSRACSGTTDSGCILSYDGFRSFFSVLQMHGVAQTAILILDVNRDGSLSIQELGEVWSEGQSQLPDAIVQLFACRECCDPDGDSMVTWWDLLRLASGHNPAAARFPLPFASSVGYGY
mmetsp:Transcript_465/g.945  ORF Transcript_465/g.945 Transcript_465/m.945 type:complete len:283 (-) Transcript_465:23-871(-)